MGIYKWIGGALGFMAAGPLGAFAGYFIGNIIDNIGHNGCHSDGTGDHVIDFFLSFEYITDVVLLWKSFPWIFFKETKRCIKCGTAPALNCVVTYLIHLIDDGEHYFGGHSCRYKRLMRIS